MNTVTQCPDPTKLRDLLSSSEVDGPGDEVVRHVELCEKCQAELARLVGDSDLLNDIQRDNRHALG